ncbi:50S ribosomal protein L20 [[Mycoplasma] imitans]|uniref:50S ribosomal protein L20 n=1 Tax=[Mycoplasma] imitans TaxID=29560 RepID=UPI000481E1B9|nr:50S ribosomal protein L20 [[Mycoplasma] imitans]
MRVKGGPTTRRRRKKWLKQAEGTFGTRHASYKVAKQTVIKSAKYAFRDRKNKKREFRALWIQRLNGALREMGVTYSVFINLLKQQQITINRKMLSEIAIHDHEAFKKLVKEVTGK